MGCCPLCSVADGNCACQVRHGSLRAAARPEEVCFRVLHPSALSLDCRHVPHGRGRDIVAGHPFGLVAEADRYFPGHVPIALHSLLD
eukprot:scaffold451_cov365-Prasinococcus_capsulatus_cf.AAC.16